MAYLAEDRYGKARVRLIKVRRDGAVHHLKDWTLTIFFKGDFDRCFRVGDNSMILPTDTIKNTVYSLARQCTAESMEAFAAELDDYFLHRNPHVTEVSTEIVEKSWTRPSVDGAEHATTFVQSGLELQTTLVTLGRDAPLAIASGLKNLVILKTANSGFEGFIRDPLTTLPEASDRLFGTEITCTWTYAAAVNEFEGLRERIRHSIVKTFAEHQSLSVQHTLFAVAESVLRQNPEAAEIKLTMPNRHCLLVDLSAFGQDNPNEIFVPIDEPYGYIEATVKRS